MRTRTTRMFLYGVGFALGVIATSYSSRLEAQSPDCPHCRGGVSGGWGMHGGLGHNLAHGFRLNPPLPAGSVCREREFPQPDIFHNYYTPGICGGVPAQMYTAPGPVPPHVGHTYYTYQPLMPHELLYKHHRVYHRYYEGGRGLTRTSVTWR